MLSFRATSILAALAAALALPGLYVGGYFWLGDYIDWSGVYAEIRVFPSDSLKQLYLPMGYLESKWKEGDVVILSASEWKYLLDVAPSFPPIVDPDA